MLVAVATPVPVFAVILHPGRLLPPPSSTFASLPQLRQKLALHSQLASHSDQRPHPIRAACFGSPCTQRLCRNFLITFLPPAVLSSPPLHTCSPSTTNLSLSSRPLLAYPLATERAGTLGTLVGYFWPDILLLWPPTRTQVEWPYSLTERTKSRKSERRLCHFLVSRDNPTSSTTPAVEFEYCTVDLIDPVVFVLAYYSSATQIGLERT